MEVEGSTSAISLLLDQVESKTLEVPETEVVRDVVTGRTVTVSSGSSFAIVIACVVGAIVLVVLIAILVIIIYRRRHHNKRANNSSYIAMTPISSGSGPTHSFIPA